jgi:hypothetical protein
MLFVSMPLKMFDLTILCLAQNKHSHIHICPGANLQLVVVDKFFMQVYAMLPSSEGLQGH